MTIVPLVGRSMFYVRLAELMSQKVHEIFLYPRIDLLASATNNMMSNRQTYRQTFPPAYRFGLNLQAPELVVKALTLGARAG